MRPQSPSICKRTDPQTVEDPARLRGSQLTSLVIALLGRATRELEDRSDGFNGRDRNEDGDSQGEFDLDLIVGGLGGPAHAKRSLFRA